MSALTIVCDNCGAKYRLPESFSGDKAKCKQCSSTIDVAAQKAAAAAPPAAAATAPSTKGAPKASESPPSGRGRAARAAAAEDKGSKRRGRDRNKTEEPAAAQESGGGRGRGDRAPREAKKSPTMLLVGGGVAALAIVAVIVVLSLGPKKNPGSTDQAKAPAADAPKVDEKQPPIAATPAATPAEAPKPAEATTDPHAGAPAEAQVPPKEPAKEPAAPAEDTAKDDGSKKEKWELNKTKSMADVFDPKTLPEIQWPAEIGDEQKTEIRDLVTSVLDGGLAGSRAKPQLEKIGYFAIYGILEGLRKLDYKSSVDQMTGFELNKLLESITVNINTGFVAVNAGEDLDPRKADHNARTNIAWATLPRDYPNKQAFEEWKQKRLSRPEKK